MSFLFPALSLSILLSSLAGSLHCVGMCGGLIMSVARTPRQNIFYHLGRLLSYLALGALAGSIGQHVFSASSMSSFQLILSLFIFLFFSWMAWSVWNQKSPHLSIIPAPLLLKIQKWSLGYGASPDSISPAFLIGLSSGLLPCGWLHTFVIAAAATGGALHGAMTLFFFWLGTIPALVSTGWVTAKFSRSMKTYSPKILAVILFAFGTGTLFLKAYPLLTPHGDPDTCPMHSTDAHE